MSRLAYVKNARRFNLYLPADLIDAAKALGVRSGKSASVVMTEALHAHIPAPILRQFRATKSPTTPVKRRRQPKGGRGERTR